MGWEALSKTKHRGKALSFERNYSFAKNVSLVPIFNFELQAAVSVIPIMFGWSKDGIQLFGMLGLQKDRNLFVDKLGGWEIQFVPAAFRSFPFRIGELKNGDKTLLFLEDSDLIVDREKGYPLFNEDSELEPITNDIARLLSQMMQSELLIKQSCSLLDEFNLFEPFKFGLQKNDKPDTHSNNLLKINVNAFRNLEEEKFLELRKTSAIDIVYAHFYSMNCLNGLLRVLNLKEKADSHLKDLGSKIFETEEKELDFNFN